MGVPYVIFQHEDVDEDFYYEDIFCTLEGSILKELQYTVRIPDWGPVQGPICHLLLESAQMDNCIATCRTMYAE